VLPSEAEYLPGVRRWLRRDRARDGRRRRSPSQGAAGRHSHGRCQEARRQPRASNQSGRSLRTRQAQFRSRITLIALRIR